MLEGGGLFCGFPYSLFPKSFIHFTCVPTQGVYNGIEQNFSDIIYTSYIQIDKSSWTYSIYIQIESHIGFPWILLKYWIILPLVVPGGGFVISFTSALHRILPMVGCRTEDPGILLPSRIRIRVFSPDPNLYLDKMLQGQLFFNKMYGHFENI